ncbi:MAG: PBP1A family penicillin-binding protein [Proteobacteria bacterium]|nr:PBP1A family penicillin-binding protein [Pseudomonadota bacterium]
MKPPRRQFFEISSELSEQFSSPPKNTRRWVVALRISCIIALITSVAAGGFAYSWLRGIGVYSLDIERIETLKHHSFADNTLVFDRNGQKIGEYFERYQIYTPVAELPEHLIQAITAIEDRSFYTHKGIDESAIIRAAWSRVKKGKITQGGSTITQQVVKHLLLNPERTLQRKVLEIAWALELEKKLSKDQILEIYVNALFLGNGAYGVGAAARRYFAKDVRSLEPWESALIAGLFQSPSRFNPARHPQRAKNRQLAVLKAMHEAGHLSASEEKMFRNSPLQYKDYRPINYEVAPWFVDWVREQLPTLLSTKNQVAESSGLRVYTTLDSSLQSLAEKSVIASIPELKALEKRTGSATDPKTGLRHSARIEASMLVTDPNDGNILAMVGGRSYKESQFNRTVNALRSPGSAFKPVVYAEALIKGWKWSDVIYVSPINIGNYKPHTPDDDFLSETTMLRAFYRSMNTPTVEIATRVGLSAIISRAKSLGVRSPIKDELGTTLGSSELTMMDLARVYGTFANSGRLAEIKGITRVTTADGVVLYDAKDHGVVPKQVVAPQIAYLMTQGMKAVLTSGTGIRSKDLADFAAGKTGTSNDSADNWFCGSSRDLTSIVWVGSDENAPIGGNVTGGALALPIWDMFLRKAMSLRIPKPTVLPPGVIAQSIHPRYGHRIGGGMTMWFLESNQPHQTESALESIESKSSGEYRRVFAH